MLTRDEDDALEIYDDRRLHLVSRVYCRTGNIFCDPRINYASFRNLNVSSRFSRPTVHRISIGKGTKIVLDKLSVSEPSVPTYGYRLCVSATWYIILL